MAYSTRADLEAEISSIDLSQLTQDPDTSKTPAEIIAGAIAAADAVINSYIGPRYDVPVAAPVPAILLDLSRDIAIYKLRTRKPGDPGEIKTKYEDAMKLLKEIGKGNADLGVDPQPDEGGQDIQQTHTKADRTFTMGKSSDSSKGTLDGYL